MRVNTPDFQKRLEARIALAIARADGGSKAQQASANHLAQLNAVPIPANNTPSFTSSPFTTVSGKLKVTCYVTVAALGGTLAPLDGVALSIVRDGVTTIGGAMGTTVEASAAGDYFVSYSFTDSVLAGSTHTYTAQINISNGHSAGIPQVTIIIEDYAG